MRVEAETLLFTSFVVLFSDSTVAASSIKPRSFLAGNYNPSPSREDGPPAAFNAVRDPKYLPAQIASIVGAYVVVTIIVGTAILILSKRSRKQAQQLKNDIELSEQQKFTTQQIYPGGPLSPGLQQVLHPPDPKGPTPYVFPTTNTWEQTSPISPVGQDPNVDPTVAAHDRNNLQQGLEDLYARVMEQEEAKLAGISPTELPPPAPVAYWQPQVPQAPAPQRNTLTKTKSRPSNIEMGERNSRTSSLISSIMSPGRKKKDRGMVISSPIPTPMRSTFPSGYPSDEEPLSPRYNKPPPPIPSDQEPYQPSHSRSASGMTDSTDPSPISPAQSTASNLQPYNRAQYGHTYNQSQTSVNTQTSRRGTPLLANPSGLPSSPRAKTSSPPVSFRQSPAPLKLSTPTTRVEEVRPDPSIGSTQRALPFRAFDPPPGLSSPSLNNPMAPATKTTVLERAAHPALLSPGLKTPWTAGAVPYSPYQPFSPLMPVTPRLVTKEDRKREKKMEKKMGLSKKPVVEMVGEDDDTWGSGY